MSVATVSPVFQDNGDHLVRLSRKGQPELEFLLKDPTFGDIFAELGRLLDPTGKVVAATRFEPWHWSCSDDCCYEWGTLMTTADGKQYEVECQCPYAALTAALEAVGIEITIDDHGLPSVFVKLEPTK